MAAAKNGAAGDDDKVVIKKYANRRLYNTAKSSYVTLDDLSQMVRAGEDFAVYDAKTGDEITHSVLTQIIFEEEQKGQNMLPTNFLRQLIRLYGDALQNVVPGYLDASMDTFARNQEKMRETFRANPALQNFEAMTRQNMELFERAVRMFNPFVPGQSRPEQDDPPGPKEVERRAEDLDDLKQKLSEMQSQLDKISKSRD